jgi:hypothetical protein
LKAILSGPKFWQHAQLFRQKITDSDPKLTIEINFVSLVSRMQIRAPRVGDHVISLCTRWKYFTATVQSYSESTKMYKINWDNDPTGREISFENIALDITPDQNQIQIGTIVLFRQGKYKAREVITSLNAHSARFRWHQGTITGKKKRLRGDYVFKGHHTKGKEDGKTFNFKDYRIWIKIECVGRLKYYVGGIYELYQS